jgi:hypothetical protein
MRSPRDTVTRPKHILRMHTTFIYTNCTFLSRSFTIVRLDHKTNARASRGSRGCAGRAQPRDHTPTKCEYFTHAKSDAASHDQAPSSSRCHTPLESINRPSTIMKSQVLTSLHVIILPEASSHGIRSLRSTKPCNTVACNRIHRYRY